MRREKILKIFTKMPTLHTERLILRPMKTSDAYDMYEYSCREDVTEYLLWSPHQSVGYTREYLACVEAQYAKGEFYDWAITLRDGGKMIGTVGFTKIHTSHNSAEIGYVLNPEYHHMGIGYEAAKRVLDFGFDILELHRAEARFMQGNTASEQLMKKLGMTFEGFGRDSMLVKGSYRTIGTYSILRDEWTASEHYTSNNVKRGNILNGIKDSIIKKFG